MAQVNAVEIADRHRAAAKRFGNVTEAAKEDHAGKILRTSIWNPGKTSSSLSVSETCSIRILCIAANRRRRFAFRDREPRPCGSRFRANRILSRRRSEARSFGESTSTARSGEPGKKPAGTDAGIRSALDEGRIGRTDGVGIATNEESAFGAEHPTEFSLLNEVVKNPAERGNHNCVQRTGGRHGDNLPLKQFTTSQARLLEQLFSRRYFRNRHHDVFIIGVPKTTVKKGFAQHFRRIVLPNKGLYL